MRTRIRLLLIAATLLLGPGLCWASNPRPKQAAGLPWAGLGGAHGSAPWNIVVLLTLLTLLPALLLSVTPFVRLLVVFHFLRQALGTQSTPSNQTLIGLALILTYFLMQPVGTAVLQTAIEPLEKSQVDALEAVELDRVRCATSC